MIVSTQCKLSLKVFFALQTKSHGINFLCDLDFLQLLCSEHYDGTQIEKPGPHGP